MSLSITIYNSIVQNKYIYTLTFAAGISGTLNVHFKHEISLGRDRFIMLKKTLVVIGLFSLIVVGGCNKQAPTTTNPPAIQTPSQSAQTPSTTPTPPNGPSTPPVTNQPATTQVNGLTLYTSNCAGCHGVGGAGGSGPAINTDEWKNNSAKVQSIVKNGKGSMPGFASSLNDTQVKAIGDYVASLKK